MKEEALIQVFFYRFSFPQSVTRRVPPHPHPTTPHPPTLQRPPLSLIPGPMLPFSEFGPQPQFNGLLSPALNPEDVALMESHTKAQKCLHAAFSQHLKAVICCNCDNRGFSRLGFVFFPSVSLLMIRFSTLFCNRVRRERDPINCFKGFTVSGSVQCHLTFFFLFL